MTKPQRYLIRMLLFLVAVAACAAALWYKLSSAFEANPILNGMILAVLLLGIGYIFRQVLQLRPEVAWFQSVRRTERDDFESAAAISGKTKPPKLLATMAAMLRERPERFTLSALSMRSILDGIQTRIDESHEISRYLIGLLVFLGLLGTFWGLLETVGGVSSAISGLSVDTSNPAAMFNELRNGLEVPLSGMGTAFSSSLFGLAGSLVLGFLELQAGQAHNRFMNDLEEWLSGVTRLGSGGALADGEQTVPVYIQALLEQTADSLDNLQRTMERGEEGRTSVNATLVALTVKLSKLSDHMQSEQSYIAQLAEEQARLRPVLARLAEMQTGRAAQPIDAATREHIRNMDLQLSRLVSETEGGREQLVQEIRSEFRLLTRTIAALAEEG
jgi:hypothetical protein